MRGADDPRRRAVPQRRARDHDARAGAHHGAALDHHRGGRPQGGAGARGAKGRHRQDLGRHPRRQVQEADPRDLWRHHRRGAQARTAGHRAHLRSRGRQGADARRDRRVRARRSRQRHRRRVRGHVQAAPEPDPHAEPAGSRREDGSELAAGGPAGRRVREARSGQHRPAAGAGLLRDSGAQPGEAQCRGRAHHARNRRQQAVGSARGDGRTW